jgi:aryl-alcohol dehydrogenase-like predicted oxidoreductase
MEYRFLGYSDIKISRIGFGGMSLEANNPRNEFLLHQAMEGGINYFDTADLYQQGMNETILGRAFHGKRDQVVLATKVGNQWRADGLGWDWNPSKTHILSSIEKSLERLQTDYIDLYQLHGGTLQDPIDDIIEAFELLKKSGKIRQYGISSIRPNVIREWVRRSSLVSVMMQYSLLDRRPEEEMLSFLYDHKVGVLARGVIAKGILVSKQEENFLNYTAEQVKMASAAIKSLSTSNRSPLGTAIQYVLQHKEISSAVMGIRTSDQLQDLLTIDSRDALGENEMDMLGNILPVNKFIDHR